MESVICTIGTENALKDLKVFFFTLSLFNRTEKPLVFILCDTKVALEVRKMYDGPINIKIALDKYDNLSREQMERLPGSNYKTKWEDFMMEKATVLSWAFNSGAKSAYLMDSDISFMGPLPNDPVSTKLGLSRHRIRPGDELKYGIYNAGFLWTSDPTIPEQWLLAAKTSRYYDQAALEDLATAQPTHEFPVQNNYGWWRMFQGVEPPITVQSFWSVFRNKDNANSGIRIYGEPVLSIHTHWDQTTSTTKLFNDFIFSKLRLLGKYEPAQILSRFLAKEFPHLLS